MGNKVDEYKKNAYREYDEISNINTLRAYVWLMILMLSVWLLSYFDIFDINKLHIDIATKVAVVSLAIPLLFKNRIDMKNRRVKYVLLFIICFVSNVAAAILTVHAVFIFVLPLLFSIQYRRRKVLWITYCVNAILMIPSHLFAFYYGICDLNIFLVSNYSYKDYMSQVENNTLTLPLNENHLLVILAFEIVPRLAILLIFTLLLNFTVMSQNRDALTIADLSVNLEHDAFSGLFNKSKFEQMIEEYYPQVKNVAVIFWDVNNLKETNDAFGHDKGDVLIKRVAEAIANNLSENSKAYRVGGDEFIMVIEDPLEGHPRAVIEAVDARLRNLCQKSGMEFSAAAGFAEGKGSSIKQVMLKADKAMYKDKDNRKKIRVASL